MIFNISLQIDPSLLRGVRGQAGTYRAHLAEGHNSKTIKALFGAAPVQSQSPALPPVPMWRWRPSPSPLRPPSRGSGNSSVSLEIAGQRVARPLSAAKFRNRNSSVNSALSRRVKRATKHRKHSGCSLQIKTNAFVCRDKHGQIYQLVIC